jgi:hypothetical protein
MVTHTGERRWDSLIRTSLAPASLQARDPHAGTQVYLVDAMSGEDMAQENS